MSRNLIPSRIDSSTEELLNNQIILENKSSFIYLHKAIWCEKIGYEGAAKYLYHHSQEEREHMLKIISYLNEVDAQPILPLSQEKVARSPEPSSLREIFEVVWKEEVDVTNSIHKIVDHVTKLKDFRTFQFLLWFLEEQREEEVLSKRALDLFEVIGEGGQSDYFVDRELGKLKEIAEKGLK